MRLMKFLGLSVLFMFISITATSQRVARRTANLPSPFSESALRAHIKFLSDDRLEGRGTGAKGGEVAALYIAEQFEALGLKGPGANRLLKN